MALQALQIKGVKVNTINGAVDLNVTQTGGQGFERNLHMHYGDWSLPSAGGAMVKRSDVNADIGVVLSHFRDAGNGAVTFNVATRYSNFKRTLVNDQPVVMKYTIHIYGSQDRADEKFSQSGTMQSSATYPDVQFNYDVTVAALGTVYVGMGRYWNDIATSSIDDEFNGGLEVYNPNPPDYRPGARLINGQEMSHNRNGGWAGRMVNGKDVELRTEQGHSASGNPPEIWLGGKAVNQLKIGRE